MVIINAVECTIPEIFDIFLSYHNSDKSAVLLTDSENLKFHAFVHERTAKCMYNSNIAALWMQAKPNSIIILTDIDNVSSTLYREIEDSYPIINVEPVGGAIT